MNNNDLLAAAPLEFECAAGTFALAVPDHELELYEELILTPYFDLTLSDFGVSAG